MATISLPPVISQNRWAKRLIVVFAIILFYFVGSLLNEQFLAASAMVPQSMQFWIIPIGLLVFCILMMLPFVPGLEIGFALLMLLSNEGALLVYLATIAALTGSYCIGRQIPHKYLIGFLEWLQLDQAADLVELLAPMSPQQRQVFLERQLPNQLARSALKKRSLTLGLLLNLPGNSLLGGGGGISMVAGMSQLLTLREFTFAVSIAVAPVPLAFFLLS